MADSLQSSMGTLVGSPKLPFFLVVPGAAAMTGMLEASFHCERWLGWVGLVGASEAQHSLGVACSGVCTSSNGCAAGCRAC